MGIMTETQGFFTAAEFADFVDSGAGFRRIYDQYIGLIQFIAGRYLRHQNDVDDVVQEVFARLYRDRGTLTKQQSIKSWLAVTARNMCIDQLRRQKKDSVPLTEVAEPVSPDQGESYARELSLQLVRDTLTELAAGGQATELKMFYLDGMKAAEIAARLGLSVSAVTTNLTRQRRRYGEMLKERVEEFYPRENRK